MTAQFPAWFIKRCLSTSLTYTSAAGPNINIKLPRTVDGTWKLWRLAPEGESACYQRSFRCRRRLPRMYGSLFPSRIQRLDSEDRSFSWRYLPSGQRDGGIGHGHSGNMLYPPSLPTVTTIANMIPGFSAMTVWHMVLRCSPMPWD